MANLKITQLTPGTPKATDEYPAVDTTDSAMAPSGTDKKYLLSDITTYISNSINSDLIKTQSISMGFGGCIANRSESVTFYKIGKFVMFKFPTFAAAVTTPGSSISSITPFPADFIPAGAGSFNIVYGGFSAIDGSTGSEPAPGQMSFYPAPSFSLAIDVYDPATGLFGGFNKTYAGVKGGSVIYLGT